MISKVTVGRDFRRLLTYLAGKERAELIGGNMAGETVRRLADEFEFVGKMRPLLSTAVTHLSLRLPPDESLTLEQWLAVAERIIAGMGYGNSPHAVFVHRDKGDEHIHVIASRIAFDGSRVSPGHDFRHLMRLCRAAERDYGLRPHPDWRAPIKPLSSRELRSLRETGGSSVRRRLQAEVAQAAQAAGSFDDFLGELGRKKISVLPQLNPCGAVAGISYGLDGRCFSGSSLGTEYTWPSLQRRLWASFLGPWDLPRLLIVRDAVQPCPPRGRKDGAANGPGRHAGQGAAIAARTPASSDAAANTSGQEAAAHLAALACQSYDLLVVDAATGAHLQFLQGGTPERITGQLGWLEWVNAAGGEILFRPAGSGEITHLRRVTLNCLSRARKAGFEAAAAVVIGADLRTKRDYRDRRIYEAWFRHGEALSPAEKWVVDRALARQLRSERLPAESSWQAEPGFGHLAGFVSHLTRRLAIAPGRQAGQDPAAPPPPRVTLQMAAGLPYSRAAAMAAGAREFLARREREERVEREIAALGGPRGAAARQLAASYADNPLGTTLPPSCDRASVEEAVLRLSLARDSHAEALDALARLEAMAAVAEVAESNAGDPADAGDPRVAGDLRTAGDPMAAGDLTAAGAAESPGSLAPPMAAAGAEDYGAAALDSAPRSWSSGSPLASEAAELAARLVSGYRSLREAERTVEDLTGLAPLPAALRLEDVAELARRRDVFLAAESRSQRLAADPESRAAERLEAAAACRTLRDEVEDYAAERGLPSPTGWPSWRAAGPSRGLLASTAEQPPREAAREDRELIEDQARARRRLADARMAARTRPAASPEPPPRLAAAVQATVRAELALEERLWDLRREAHGLCKARERVEADLAAAERLAERRPSPANLATCSRLLLAAADIDDRLAPLARRLAHLDAHRQARGPDRLERGPLQAEAPGLGRGMAPLAAELRAARREARLCGRELTQVLSAAEAARHAPAPRPDVVERWREALSRRDRAESALARHLDAAERRACSAVSGVPARNARDLDALLGRVRRGDATPETLSCLHRAVARELTAANAPSPGLARSVQPRPHPAPHQAGQGPGASDHPAPGASHLLARQGPGPSDQIGQAPGASAPARHGPGVSTPAGQAPGGAIHPAASSPSEKPGLAETLAASRADSAAVLAGVRAVERARAPRSALPKPEIAPVLPPLPEMPVRLPLTEAPAHPPLNEAPAHPRLIEAPARPPLPEAPARPLLTEAPVRPRLPEREALERLGAALGRCRASAAELHHRTDLASPGRQRLLPVELFLRHPGCERAPHLAVLAWSAHAAREGLDPAQAAEALARTARPRISALAALSPAFARLAAEIGARHLDTLAREAHAAVLDSARQLGLER